MKVNSYPQITQLLNRVSDKTGDKQGGAGSNAYEQQQKKKDDKEFQATVEEVEAAIETFANDEVNQAQGITATAEGSGPGLKVVLKNSEGGVLRAVSGEEFLRLREAVNSGSKSGRILDQKA